jgi:hypothetical protein
MKVNNTSKAERSRYPTNIERYIHIIEEESPLTEKEIEELMNAKREALMGLLSEKQALMIIAHEQGISL